MTRERIYEILEKEREYQKKWEVEGFEETNNLSDYILYAEEYLNRAKLQPQIQMALWDGTRASYDLSRLDNLRKVAAILLATFERFGVTERQ